MSVQSSYAVLNEITEELRHSRSPRKPFSNKTNTVKQGNFNIPSKQYNIYVATDGETEESSGGVAHPEFIIDETVEGLSTIVSPMATNKIQFSKQDFFSPQTAETAMLSKRQARAVKVPSSTQKSGEIAARLRSGVNRAMDNLENSCAAIKQRIDDLLSEEPLSLDYIKSKYSN